MVILGVLIFLVIFSVFVLVRNYWFKIGEALEIAAYLSLIWLFVLLIICAVTPAQYKESYLEATYELSSFKAGSFDDVYVMLNGDEYFCYHEGENGTNYPSAYPTSEVKSVVYIGEQEKPRICKYVQECKWTWYAPPKGKDIVSYVLYVPGDDIFYGAIVPDKTTKT